MVAVLFVRMELMVRAGGVESLSVKRGGITG